MIPFRECVTEWVPFLLCFHVLHALKENGFLRWDRVRSPWHTTLRWRNSWSSSILHDTAPVYVDGTSSMYVTKGLVWSNYKSKKRPMKVVEWCVIMIASSHTKGERGSTVVKVLCYKSESRWFDPSWCHWIFHWHKIPSISLWPWGGLSL